ncbi:CRISPR-associated endonuclease Cas1 [Streptomyces scabiei]|uniref:CRISPR-associated endonuclease Cas1 n=1 Tax=Streptomyces scabiei TaxID=1930 RepID=UPI0029A7270D|nr:CRISPR-associated endonuclease Cas1 [Streptomyces scabiei]MDX2689287.1 CRISPR-associated endonuclease Cas1 [Streptomyces scabiei]
MQGQLTYAEAIALGDLPDIHNRESTDSRVIVVHGFGVSVKVNRGHLVIASGDGHNRQETKLSRIERTVRRIIILNANGYISFDAVKWCRDVGIELIYTDQFGNVVTSTTPMGDYTSLRRAQAFAGVGGPYETTGLRVTKAILARKLSGQAANLRLMGHHKAASQVDERAQRIAESSDIDQCRGYEGDAASIYWGAWTGTVGIPWKESHAVKLPAHWGVYVSRASLVSNRARGATDPVNAMLNFCYWLAESECVLACHAVGLDPEFGVLHLDKDGRNSFALDLMEVIRPEVDRFVLEMIGAIGDNPRSFHRAEFTETREGLCRLVAPLTHELAEQSIRWGRILAPIAEEYAGMFASPATGAVRFDKPTRDKVIMRAPAKHATAKKGSSKPAHIELPSSVSQLVPEDVWESVSLLLPQPKTTGRTPIDSRAVLAGILCVELHGSTWRKIPHTLGVSDRTCRTRLQEWKQAGIWETVLATASQERIGKHESSKQSVSSSVHTGPKAIRHLRQAIGRPMRVAGQHSGFESPSP